MSLEYLKKTNLLFLCFVINLSLITSCSNDTQCQHQLSSKFSEIEEYLDSLNIGTYELDNCISNSRHIRQFGNSKTNSNGIFYIDSCDFESLTITTFEFKVKTYGKIQNLKFSCYQFNDEKELLKFDEFKNSMSRSMTHTKEIHTFFKKNNKWFLYYKGFP